MHHAGNRRDIRNIWVTLTRISNGIASQRDDADTAAADRAVDLGSFQSWKESTHRGRPTASQYIRSVERVMNHAKPETAGMVPGKRR